MKDGFTTIATLTNADLGEIRYLVECWPTRGLAEATLLPSVKHIRHHRDGLNELMDWFAENHQMLAAGQYWYKLGEFPSAAPFTFHKLATGPFWANDKTIMRAAARELKTHGLSVFPADDERFTNGDPGYVYLAFCDTGHFKIGRSVDPDARIQHFDTQMPVEVVKSHAFHADNASWAEACLHDWFAECRVKGEWFALSDAALMMLHSLEQFRDGHFIQRFADRNVSLIDPERHIPRVRPDFPRPAGRELN